ncbi:MAG TPA: non-canonical purine NTP pyrophosphatase, RdgB/HAM1 family [Firmicutes bacterium]|nr:non-canonical purine NTP pyrophosphatase, RdgB/HAM1 family [Bacillota bacterium]HBX24870.1 non-canonical purine NTP pyrophosphatase, RdgB/HAM1 family [Bacillota bacterium]
MNKEICLSTNNKNKLKEYRELLSPLGYVIYCPNDLNIDLQVNENGKTYRENSYLKALALSKLVSFPVIADDSGLEIKSLNNFPGLYSARFELECGSYQKAYQEIFSRLKGKSREARFVCCICYLESSTSKPLYFEGEVKGEITKQAHGTNGFGYDPIFYCQENNKYFGLISEEEKNKISHRYKASKKLALFLAI